MSDKPASERQVGGEHYLKYRIQPKVFFHANGVPHLEASIMEYVLRWRDKGGEQDLRKAQHLIDLLIELEGKADEYQREDERRRLAVEARADDFADEP